jgi:hypothetical protein
MVKLKTYNHIILCNALVTLINFYCAKLQCFLLKAKYKYLKEEILVEKIYYIDKLAMPGSKIEICWITKGCYKIKVNDILIPGTQNSILYSFEPDDNHIFIKFYGLNQIIEKQLDIQYVDLVLEKQFETTININHAYSIPISVGFSRNFLNTTKLSLKSKFATNFQTIKVSVSEMAIKLPIIKLKK